jgi:integrase
MPRTIERTPCQTPAKRTRLAPRGRVYWCDEPKPGWHLGFRRNKGGGGKWIARRFVDSKTYELSTFASAAVEGSDSDADGVTVMSFEQARARVLALAAEHAEKARHEAAGPALTVASAIEDYCLMREQRGGFGRDARLRLTRHVLSNTTLAATTLADLKADALADWRSRLSVVSPASARRTGNDFRATLNFAGKRHAKRLPPRFRDTVRDGLAIAHGESGAGAREPQVLPDADVRRIVEAAWQVDADGGWDGDLARLVLVLASTGGRFSQVVRLAVADVQFDRSRIMVPASRKGRAGASRPPAAVPVGSDVLGALRSACAGRMGHEPLLLRPRLRLSGMRWERYGQKAWVSSSELAYPWRAIVARAGLSAGTIPYSLRHSSIVRGLRAGLPVQLVSRLHDTSPTMLTNHYARFIDDALDELGSSGDRAVDDGAGYGRRFGESERVTTMDAESKRIAERSAREDLIARYVEQRVLDIPAPDAERFVIDLVERRGHAMSREQLAEIFKSAESRFLGRATPPSDAFSSIETLLREAKERAIDQPEPERKPRDTITRATALARERLGNGVYTDGDTADLKASLAAANEANERLDSCLSALAVEHPSLAIEARHNLEALVRAVYAIGGLSVISESADRLAVNDWKTFRITRELRNRKEEETKQRHAALEKAVLQCVGGDPTCLSSSADKMAPSRDAVREMLPQLLPSFDPSKKWPATETLRKAIPGIKKRAIQQKI